MELPMRGPLLPLPVAALLTGAAACLLQTSACKALRPVGVDELRGPSPLDSVRVTLADHSSVVLYGPKVVGDTLEGTVQRWDGPAHQRFLLSQTTAIQAREAAPDRTAGLIFAGVVGVGALVVYETTKGGCTPDYFEPPDYVHYRCS